jgi:hypothetical protein
MNPSAGIQREAFSVRALKEEIQPRGDDEHKNPCAPSSNEGNSPPEKGECNSNSETYLDESLTRWGPTVEDLVQQYIDGHPSGRIEEAMKLTSLTAQKIRRTQAWKNGMVQSARQEGNTLPDGIG